jgi:hypothetical protein
MQFNALALQDRGELTQPISHIKVEAVVWSLMLQHVETFLGCKVLAAAQNKLMSWKLLKQLWCRI